MRSLGVPDLARTSRSTRLMDMSPSVSPDINPANRTSRTIITMRTKNSVSQHRYSAAIQFFSSSSFSLDFSSSPTAKFLTSTSQQVMTNDNSSFFFFFLIFICSFTNPKNRSFGFFRERARREGELFPSCCYNLEMRENWILPDFLLRRFLSSFSLLL